MSIPTFYETVVQRILFRPSLLLESASGIVRMVNYAAIATAIYLFFALEKEKKQTKGLEEKLNKGRDNGTDADKSNADRISSETENDPEMAGRELLANAITDGIVIFETGKQPFISQNYLKLYGLAMSETKEDIIKFPYRPHGDDEHATIAKIEKAMFHKEPNIVYEYRSKHSDGTFFMKEDSVSFFYDLDGKPFKWVISSKNIERKKKFEKSRIQREQLLSRVFDASTDAIFILEPINRDYDLVMANHAFHNLFPQFGKEASRAKGKLPFIAHANFDEKAATVLQRGLSLKWQETYVSENKETFMEATLSPMFDENGVTDKLIVTIHDLTDFTIAERNIHKLHNRLVKLTEKLPTAIFEFELDQEGMGSFPFISKYIETLVPHVAPGNLFLSADAAFDAIYPDDKKTLLDKAETSKKTLQSWESEFRIKSLGSDGYRWNKLVGHPEKKENGSVIWYGYWEDIHAIKEEEIRLKLFRSAFANSSEGMVISKVVEGDTSGTHQKIVFANESFFKMCGYGHDELVDDLTLKLRGPKTDLQEVERLDSSFHEGKACEIEIVNYKKNGEEFWVNIAIAPVKDDNDFITHWIAIQRDVTEKKNDLANIQEQNEKLRDIAWMQSHVVRAPLARLMGLIDMLEHFGENQASERTMLLSHLSSSAKELDVVVREIVAKTDTL